MAASAARETSRFDSNRLQSLDVYRGLIMALLAFQGFGLAGVASNYLEARPDSATWRHVRFHFEHAEWVGGGLWDMVQPSFMFMVGVSLAYSYAARAARGQGYFRMLAHALWRGVVLSALGIFLISNGKDATNWSLMNVLTQIGLGYPLLFLLWNRPRLAQAGAAAALLAATWLAYALYPGAGLDPNVGAPERGVPADWARRHLAGVPPAWHKNANVGHALDTRLLNWFPRDDTDAAKENDTFRFNKGGYQTLNFAPSLATMLFGLLAGELLRGEGSSFRKLLTLLLAGAAGILLGWALHASGACPLVKRIWTPAWTLYSTGWCLLTLATLYAVVDVMQSRWWTFPFVVVGVNSIAVYCLEMLSRDWIIQTFQTHCGPGVFLFAGANWEPAAQRCAVGIVCWLAAWRLYANNIHVRV